MIGNLRKNKHDAQVSRGKYEISHKNPPAGLQQAEKV
jgi:hypothetical protein